MGLRNLVSSEDPRTGKSRLTPPGRVIVVVVGFAVVAGVIWVVSTVLRGAPLDPVATATLAPGVTPSATAPATETPMVVIPAPDLSDSEELSRLREQFLEAWEWYWASELPHNLDDVGYYWAPIRVGIDDWVFQPGPETLWCSTLDSVTASLQERGEQGLLYQVVQDGGEWLVSLERRDSGNAWAVLEAQYEGGLCTHVVVETGTGEEFGRSEPETCSRYVVGMVWDGYDGKWKVASMWSYAQ